MLIGIEADALGSEGRGLERHLRCLLEGLVKLDGPERYVLYRSSPMPEDAPRLDERFEVAVGRGPQAAPWINWRLPRLANRHPCDLLHFPVADFWLRERRTATLTLHDLTPLHEPERFFKSRLRRLAYDRTLAAAARLARAILTVSEHSRDDIVHLLNVDPDRVFVVPNGLDERFFAPPDESRDGEVLRRYGLSEEFVLYVGGLDYRKNLERLLGAFSIVRGAGSRAELAIVGTVTGGGRGFKADLGRLKRDPALAGAVRLLGRVSDEDLEVLYRRATVFAFPSLAEGFGYPPLEAMASGTPVVSSNVSCLPEILGDGAILADPLDESSIARALSSLLVDERLRAEMSRKGRERAEFYTVERMARGTLAVWRQALQGTASYA